MTHYRVQFQRSIKFKYEANYSNPFVFRLGAEGRATGVYIEYMRIARTRRQQRLKAKDEE